MGVFLTSSFLNVWISPTPCLERVRRLERQGFIQGYTALLNPHYLDASLLVFVEITLNRGAPDVLFEQFNTAVQKLEEIQECHLVSGDFDYLLKTRVPDMSAYRKLLGKPCCVCLASMTHGHTLLWKKSSRVIVWLLRRANTEQVQNRRIFDYTPVNPYSNSTRGNLVLLSVLASGRKACNLESLS